MADNIQTEEESKGKVHIPIKRLDSDSEASRSKPRYNSSFTDPEWQKDSNGVPHGVKKRSENKPSSGSNRWKWVAGGGALATLLGGAAILLGKGDPNVTKQETPTPITTTVPPTRSSGVELAITPKATLVPYEEGGHGLRSIKDELADLKKELGVSDPYKTAEAIMAAAKKDSTFLDAQWIERFFPQTLKTGAEIYDKDGNDLGRVTSDQLKNVVVINKYALMRLDGPKPPEEFVKDGVVNVSLKELARSKREQEILAIELKNGQVFLSDYQRSPEEMEEIKQLIASN